MKRMFQMIKNTIKNKFIQKTTPNVNYPSLPAGAVEEGAWKRALVDQITDWSLRKSVIDVEKYIVTFKCRLSLKL